MKFVGADDSVRPAKCTTETRKPSAKSYCQRAGRVARPYKHHERTGYPYEDILPAQYFICISIYQRR